MEIPAWLPAAAARAPDRCALETPTASLSYAELLGRADVVARRLAGLGVARGDRVALAITGVDFAETFHGCLRLGAVAVPLHPRLLEDERSPRTADASLVLHAPPRGPEADAPLLDAHGSDDVVAVLHTSGTTSAPRPVALTAGNFASSAGGSAAVLGADPAERWLCTLPLAHVGGLSILVRSAIDATTSVVHEHFHVQDALAALRERGITLVSLVPTTLHRLLDAGLTAAVAPSLRCALIGGGPLSDELIERGGHAGVPLAQTYGLTEACSQVSTSAIGSPRTAGRPLPGTSITIAPDKEILVAGPTVAPAAVAADGRLHTGDLGELDAGGRLRVIGRKADTIVTGGENVAPVEVESVLAQHPSVAEVAVHARPDPEWGEAVVARVVLRSGATASPDELREHCRAHVASFKVPKAIEFADALPRTESGKLLRRTLT